MLRETLATVLQGEGFKVSVAASGEEAEALLVVQRPFFDLVITDLVMPGRGGMDVLRTALEVDPGCTVLVLTGFGSVREATEAVDAGAFGLVTKPLQVEQFRNTLRRLLERAMLIHERDQLRTEVQHLQAKVEELQTTLGRLEMMARQIAPARPEVAGAGLEELHRLAGLREKGLLTEEQFESTKKALLARWAP